MMIRTCQGKKVGGHKGSSLRVAAYHFYRTAANPAAVTPRAIIAWNIRPSTDRVVIAALELLALPPAPPVVEAPLVMVPEAEPPELGVATTGKDDVTTMDDAVVGVDESDVVPTGRLPLVDEEPAAEEPADEAPVDEELAPVGGGLASAAFASAPVPHGTA